MSNRLPNSVAACNRIAGANTRLLRGLAPVKKTVIEVVTKFLSTTISGD